jgi:hypothetical protein
MLLYDMFSAQMGEYNLIEFILATVGPWSRHRSAVHEKPDLLQVVVFSLAKEACDANTY